MGLPPVAQALVATLFTWFLTALGASCVFALRDVDRRLLDVMLGFTSGVMIAAAFWSLLAPAVELSGAKGIAWVPPMVGFLMGGLFLRGADRVLPHLHLGFSMDESEGIRTSWRRTTLLILAVTLHNIPEGLAVGIAFGGAAMGLPAATVAAATILAIGIGLQNFPEGLAVSLPLRGEGLSRWRSFLYGQASGMVEPLAGVLGAMAVAAFQPLLPYALGFAAGAMIYVAVEETIPESQRWGNTDLATMGTLVGLTIMTALDVSFS